MKKQVFTFVLFLLTSTHAIGGWMGNADISALYHLGIPFRDVTTIDGLSQGIKNMKGEIITGSTTGAEIRFSMKFLFGAESPEAE
jgi:hypothetical protein